MMNKIGLMIALVSALFTASGFGADQQGCQKDSLSCAKTVTSAFAPDGRLWRLWSADDQLFYSISTDKGLHFGQPVKVASVKEAIASKGENRPKLAFDQLGGVYLSWAKPLGKRFTSDIRFSYSRDGGKQFSAPITVNNDGLTIGHSFNEMLVSADGLVTMTWLDGRERHKDPQYQGSALYSATGKLTAKGIVFNNIKLADQTCVCCRVAMADTSDQQVAVFWRHIYDDNIRDHGILTFAKQDPAAQLKKPQRVTFDQWQINGCPHQGPGISVDPGNRYHMVWYNDGSVGQGLFYGYSDEAGKLAGKALSLGNADGQAAHPHVISHLQQVDVVWTAFNGQQFQLYHQRSTDRGAHFAPAQVIATSTAEVDRPFLLHDGHNSYVSWQTAGQGHQVIRL